MTPALLAVEDLHFAHSGGKAVLDHASLRLTSGELLVIVGPSGCGKTTLLRCIAGLDKPQAGRIILQDRVLTGMDTFVPPEARDIGFVFQGLALFPHLTVTANIAFGLHDVPRNERNQRVNEELEVVGLRGFGHRYPHELSGGQQQRVAIARSLVRRPALMLMDEPFSDLDPRTRSDVRTEVLRILQRHGTTTILVTHDREDALHMADRIAEMDHGRILRIGPGEEFRSGWSEPTSVPK